MKYIIFYKFHKDTDIKQWFVHDDHRDSEFDDESKCQTMRDALATCYPKRTYKIATLTEDSDLEKTNLKGVK